MPLSIQVSAFIAVIQEDFELHSWAKCYFYTVDSVHTFTLEQTNMDS